MSEYNLVNQEGVRFRILETYTNFVRLEREDGKEPIVSKERFKREYQEYSV